MKVLTAGMMLGTLVATPVCAGVADGPKHVHRVFDIMRAGSKIGTDTFDVTRSGDVTKVNIASHIVVKIAFVTVYRYDHTESESWKGNQLTSFTSQTDDNGTTHQVSAIPAGGKMDLTVDGKPTTAGKGIVPASVWTATISQHSQLFDPASGKRLAVKAEDLGQETVALNGVPRQLEHVKLTGQFDRDLWFDEGGLVKMTLLGSDRSTVTSQLRQSTASR